MLGHTLSDMLGHMLAAAGMLVVLDRSGQLFTRAWCLWEVWAMGRAHSAASIAWVTCTAGRSHSDEIWWFHHALAVVLVSPA